MTEVRVKKLEWVPTFPNAWRAASGFGGAYELTTFKFMAHPARLYTPDGGLPEWHASDEDAKAAAQADFERRVRSCLEMSDE